ncbi:hypothetical protein TNCV_2694521 [Trichonephila clavipes]|nr:hypothetical protein TNCV_2694521 [Trichonephila clavipes]
MWKEGESVVEYHSKASHFENYGNLCFTDAYCRVPAYYPGKDGVPRVSRIRISYGERIRPFQRLYPLEVPAKTEIGVLKATGKDSLPVEKTHESSIDHVSDSPTDYVPDSLVESTDNSEEKPPTKTTLGRTIKIP